MKQVIWNKLSRQEQQQLLERPAITTSFDIQSAVSEIKALVQTQGDQALLALTERFDRVKLEQITV